MIRHIVLCDLRPDHDAAELRAVMDGLHALQGRLAGFTAFTAGPNRDFEGLSTRYPFGFICDFDGETALRTYLDNPDHRALGARLVALSAGGLLVADLDLSTS